MKIADTVHIAFLAVYVLIFECYIPKTSPSLLGDVYIIYIYLYP